MFLNKIEYENYRNLKNGVFEPSKEINIIYGDNAQGKTNLIEAIWLFTGEKSFRGAKDIQMKNKDNSSLPVKLKAYFFSGEREQNAEIKITDKRNSVLNGSKTDSNQKLGEHFSAFVFSPADLDLIKDGPAVRRKFLDNAISFIRPKYAKILSDYNRMVMQRNSILRDVAFHRELEFMLDIYEQRIAKYGAFIIGQRKKYIEALMQFIPDIYNGISSNKENLLLNYRCTCGTGNEESILAKLKESRVEDTKNGSTGVGPHRDEFEFFINKLSVKFFGSQGQKRSCVLALKLSEAEIVKKYSGEQPIALLDDVMSELDRSRQDYILNHIKGWQVFITCCDPAAIECLKDGKCFKMTNGELEISK